MSKARVYNKMFKDYPDVVTIKELQQMLGIGKNLAYELVNTNAIPHTKIGRRIIVTKTNVIKYLLSEK